ncbi:hypothetical protein ED312_11790 [Sinomicrobium pectinilyticum]|uniref:Uncharacterized protein n=1 Tax=Sinomicrobium pectinilyticum TaxID=1084421 RepID=A0A3N0EDV6_SINP1|nr:hypothetical protein [Sinomicrobium pectinilyticum]RNL85991.1 hypothetical protein ED312_11790 [Sinomicrobium pectinilyticum]
MKFLRISEIIYLVVAVLSVIETVRRWNADRNMAYVFAIFGVVSVFMFFFRRHYRKKFEQRRKDNR